MKTIDMTLRAIVGDANPVDARLLQVFLKSVLSEVVCEPNAMNIWASVVRAERNDSEFGLVILNRTLQRLDGVQTTQLLRYGGYAGTIVGTSTELSAELQDEWTAAGADMFLTKPILAESLFPKIMAALCG